MKRGKESEGMSSYKNSTMKKLFLIMLVFIVLLFLFISSVSSFKETEKSKVKVFVSLRNEEKNFFGLQKVKLTAEEKQELKQEVINEISEDNKNNIRNVFSNSLSAEVSEQELAILKKDSRINIIKMSNIHAFLQDSTALVNATSTWSVQTNGINITGAGETVCVIDTGVNFSHPDLRGKNLTCNINCLTQNCVENCSVSDDNGHGTHVAGIIAANGSIRGVAPGARIMSLKILDSAGSGSPDDLKLALDWCINNQLTYNISAISLSLGCNATKDGYTSYCDSQADGCLCDELAVSINNATSKNISVIAATGNYANFTAIAAPACIQNTTAVAATDKNDNLYNYNRNSLTDLVAPGISITSTSMSGGYEPRSGTSMAAPHVAAAFALLRQFKKLEKNQILRPSEIQRALNNTGKIINDATSGLNFSRVDIYSAILSLDETAPNATLIQPTDNYASSSQNQTFRCNATDLQLANISLQAWNSSSFYYSNTTSVSGNFATAEFNLTNIPFNSYKWNCFASDTKGNGSYAAANFSLTIGNISMILSYPPNNTSTNTNETNFNCNSTTISGTQLTNTTFYLWNSTSLLNTTTINISGTQNSTTFSYNLTIEQEYKWNCLVYNNQSNSTFAASNYTITYDITKPAINLTTPSNSSTYTASNTIDFYYNVTDTNSIANCSLIINNSINKTATSINNSVLNNITVYLANSIYDWQINCTDSAGNENASETRVLTVNYEEEGGQQPPNDGGGGGGTTTGMTYNVPEEKLEKGYTRELSVKDKLSFNISNKKHLLEVNKTTNNSVIIKISSETIITTLLVNETKNFDLDSDNYYDLQVKLNNIKDNKANLTIIKINKPVELEDKETNKSENRTLNPIVAFNETGKEERKWSKDNWFLIALLVIILIVIVFLVVSIRDSRKPIKL